MTGFRSVVGSDVVEKWVDFALRRLAEGYPSTEMDGESTFDADHEDFKGIVESARDRKRSRHGPRIREKISDRFYVFAGLDPKKKPK